MNNKDEMRNSSFELLRIIAAIGVIVVHYNHESIGKALGYVISGSINEYYLVLMECIFIGATNLFVMLSGYFLCTIGKRKIVKIVDLILEVILFRIICYLVNVAKGNYVFNIKGVVENLLPQSYFIILYATLYIISPYINILLRSITQKTFRRLVVVSFMLFSVGSILVDFLGWEFDIVGLSTIGAYGSQTGRTIVNFVLLYIIGAFIRLNDIHVEKRKLGVVISVVLLIMFGITIFERRMGLQPISRNLNNSLIILICAFVIMIFEQIRFHSRIINELARGCFTSYIINSLFVAHLDVRKAVSSGLGVLVGHQVVSAIAIFGISYIVFKLYLVCSRWFLNLIMSPCNRLDHYININE